MHLKRISSPGNWKIGRKKTKWITRTMPGPHALDESINLNILIKYFLKYAKTTKEVKSILNEGKILINKKPRKDYRFPVGIMDIIEIPSLKENYILVYDNTGNFIINKINNNNEKLGKIIGKTYIKGGKLQINLNDGRNIIISKDDYKLGDSVIIDLNENKIKKHIKMEKGANIYITKGNYKGNIGKVVEIKKGSRNNKPKVTFKLGNRNYETLKKYTFPVPDEKSIGVSMKNE